MKTSYRFSLKLLDKNKISFPYLPKIYRKFVRKNKNNVD